MKKQLIISVTLFLILPIIFFLYQYSYSFTRFLHPRGVHPATPGVSIGSHNFFILNFVALAAPYRPPPQEPGGNEPEENVNGPRPSDRPTPTPCVPNFCFFEETPCCFSPMCVLVGNISADPPERDRCPESTKVTRLIVMKNGAIYLVKKFSQFIDFFL